MCHQLLQVAGHILLELADALRAKGVGDHFAFAGVFGAVACVEEASLNGDKCVVIVAVKTRFCELLLMRIRGRDDVRKKMQWKDEGSVTFSAIPQCGHR